jgi:hypothetical protein
VGQDPYGDQGGFTPYQPDATPDAEPPAGGTDEPAAGAPYVPYVATSGTYSSAFVTTTSATRSASRKALPWLLAVVVLLATCGGGIAGIVGLIAGSDSDSGTSSSSGRLANDLQAGQCLIGAGLDPSSNDSVSDLEVVDCSTGHDAEVIAVNVLDANEAAAYDFDDDNGAFKSCKDYFNTEQMKLLNRPDLYLIALTGAREPQTGDKVACLLTNEDGSPLHGSLNDPTPEPLVSPS